MTCPKIHTWGWGGFYIESVWLLLWLLLYHWRNIKKGRDPTFTDEKDNFPLKLGLGSREKSDSKRIKIIRTNRRRVSTQARWEIVRRDFIWTVIIINILYIIRNNHLRHCCLNSSPSINSATFDVSFISKRIFIFLFIFILFFFYADCIYGDAVFGDRLIKKVFSFFCSTFSFLQAASPASFHKPTPILLLP